MYLRILGALLVCAGGGGMGMRIAWGYRQEERMLTMLLQALDTMVCQLRYRMTALPELCDLASGVCSGALRHFFGALAWQLSLCVETDAATCVTLALETTSGLPAAVERNLRLLGVNLGRFDAQGQLSGLQSVMELAQRDLDGLRAMLHHRLRACRTLGFCAGAALAILLL